MRRIPLKDCELERIPTQAQMNAPADAAERERYLAQFKKRFSYAEQMKLVLENAPQGRTIGDMRRALSALRRIDTAVAAGQDHVVLEETEYAFLKAQIETIQWTVMDPVVLAFVDDIANAEVAG